MYHKWLSIIIIGLWRVLGLGAEVFGQSAVLCSNWQYSIQAWWWCCGDGVVNGPSGVEECDNKWLNVSFSNSEARWGSVVCKSDCSIDTSAGSAGWSTQSCGGAWAGFKYKIEDNLFCNSDSNRLSRILYDYNTDQPIPFRVLNSLGQLEYNTLYNSCGFGEPYYTAMCGNCPCWNGSACIACPTTPSCTQTNGGVEICGDGIDQDCNGSDLACGSPASCTNLPANATPCNSLSPSSNTNYTTVSSCSSPAIACEAQCAGTTIFNGGICESPAYTQYSCGAGASCAWGTQWAWTANASCGSITYNPSNIYARNLSVCNNTAPPASSCQSTCEDPACGSTAGTCDVWSPSNDNNSNACNTSRTWNCGAASCSIYNWPCVSNGICRGSVWVCASPAQASNVTASTWTCPGTNGGADAPCGTTGPTVSCGDGVRNWCFVTEECDGSPNQKSSNGYAAKQMVISCIKR